MDRHELYDLTVQSPALLVPYLRAIHGGEPEVLGEDFSGTGALSRAWAASGGRAIAVDLDRGALARARARGVTTIHGDVRTATDRRVHAADVIFVGNFSIGELHTRGELTAYLRHARSRLRRGGVFVCDTYGGESAFRTGVVERTHVTPDGLRVRYAWEQRRADPLTGMVENAMHFRVFRGRELVERFADAFVYRWRLWSAPELRDAVAEAGFARTEVYAKAPDAVDSDGRAYVRPIEEPDELDESFIVCVAGRAAGAER